MCACFPFSKLFHVRSVTQGDVIRADAKDIPRIFQVRTKKPVVFIINSGEYCGYFTSKKSSVLQNRGVFLQIMNLHLITIFQEHLRF